jgi:hypothetical protein
LAESVSERWTRLGDREKPTNLRTRDMLRRDWAKGCSVWD